MKALLQRVTRARVTVQGECVGAIDRGLLVFLGVDRDDTAAVATTLMERVLAYRIFPDEEGRMNWSVTRSGGGILLVSQFTLSADTHKGLRPSFSTAADPALAETLYEHSLAYLGSRHQPIACGRFGADMQVELVNDGPVTFLLEVQAQVTA